MIEPAEQQWIHTSAIKSEYRNKRDRETERRKNSRDVITLVIVHLSPSCEENKRQTFQISSASDRVMKRRAWLFTRLNFPFPLWHFHHSSSTNENIIKDRKSNRRWENCQVKKESTRQSANMKVVVLQEIRSPSLLLPHFVKRNHNNNNKNVSALLMMNSLVVVRRDLFIYAFCLYYSHPWMAWTLEETSRWEGKLVHVLF